MKAIRPVSLKQGKVHRAGHLLRRHGLDLHDLVADGQVTKEGRKGIPNLPRGDLLGSLQGRFIQGTVHGIDGVRSDDHEIAGGTGLPQEDQKCLGLRCQ